MPPERARQQIEGRERSRALLAKTFAALAPGGTIAIAEFLVNPDRRGPIGGLLFAVNMLVNTDAGASYSEAEYTRWMKDAGFSEVNRIKLPGPSDLIVGRVK